MLSFFFPACFFLSLSHPHQIIPVHSRMIVVLNRFFQHESAFQEKIERLLSCDGGELPIHLRDRFKNCPSDSFSLVFGQDAEVNDGLGALPPLLEDDISGVFPVDFDPINSTRTQHCFPRISVPDQIRIVINPELVKIIKIYIRIEVFPQSYFHLITNC